MSKQYRLDLNDLHKQILGLDERSYASQAETNQALVLLAIAERLEEIARAFAGGYIETAVKGP